MTNKTLQLAPEVQEYLLAHSLREPELLARLRAETATLPQARMQIAPEQGQFMALLVRLIGARKALEIGSFTGYSALCTVLAMPSNGRLIACDTSEEWTAIAQRYWQEAGVRDRIDLRLAPATETLDKLLVQGEADSFDFVFIDADKQNYTTYYDYALKLLRPGGLIAIDNVLWSGQVADPEDQKPGTRAIRDFNARLKDDARVDLSMVPIADGLTLARKRETHSA
ncbi:SAM-dependent methyltransferase [Alkalilimnicola ehrlichii]|uniref:SAM-dependent methyltransferase n=1 Tax=Alkalilimnicola ehrlichii TaxID=351052 RepID=A0A3E0X1B8_9GAMM|nr:class I SAM-dependent methyltransferase [Alkalilimnicola ehrlichii]RFA31441.1 SAM-dependent methyltransferase [Alkalilimnicola ehrlichii]RFA39287.1 SAM-dependent methyltransferase [Alkalilimnicola ehrlichii]